MSSDREFAVRHFFLGEEYHAQSLRNFLLNYYQLYVPPEQDPDPVYHNLFLYHPPSDFEDRELDHSRRVHLQAEQVLKKRRVSVLKKHTDQSKLLVEASLVCSLFDSCHRVKDDHKGPLDHVLHRLQESAEKQAAEEKALLELSLEHF